MSYKSCEVNVRGCKHQPDLIVELSQGNHRRPIRFTKTRLYVCTPCHEKLMESKTVQVRTEIDLREVRKEGILQSYKRVRL